MQLSRKSLAVPSSDLSKRLLFLPLLVGSLVAGYLPSIEPEGGVGSLNQNVIPAFAFLLGVKCWWSADTRAADKSDRIVVLLLSLLFLIPSTQGGWLILLLQSLWLCRYTRSYPMARSGLLIMALAALQPMLVTYLLKWFAAPVLTLDAMIVAALLMLTTGEGAHVGNIVYGPSDHQLLILRGCSSISNLGSAWLSWFALSRFKGLTLNRREVVVIALLTTSIVGLNLLRLYTMGSHLDWHAWWHSDNGVRVYQLASVSLLFLVILLGMRYVGSRR